MYLVSVDAKDRSNVTIFSMNVAAVSASFPSGGGGDRLEGCWGYTPEFGIS